MTAPVESDRIGGVVFVLECDGSFLVERRDDIGDFGEQWYFPAEKVEGLETPPDTLARGIREEFGGEVTAHGWTQLEDQRRPAGSDRYLMRPFFVHDWTGEEPGHTDRGHELTWLSSEALFASPVPIVREITARACAEIIGRDTVARRVEDGADPPELVTYLAEPPEAEQLVEVPIVVGLPESVALEVAKVTESDPLFLSRAVLYGMNRRTIFRRLEVETTFGKGAGDVEQWGFARFKLADLADGEGRQSATVDFGVPNRGVPRGHQALSNAARYMAEDGYPEAALDFVRMALDLIDPNRVFDDAADLDAAPGIREVSLAALELTPKEGDRQALAGRLPVEIRDLAGLEEPWCLCRPPFELSSTLFAEVRWFWTDALNGAPCFAAFVVGRPDRFGEGARRPYALRLLRPRNVVKLLTKGRIAAKNETTGRLLSSMTPDRTIPAGPLEFYPAEPDDRQAPALPRETG